MSSERLVGQQIDQYRIERHIARGGMADVYLAQDVDLERYVAFKVMLDTLALETQFVQRFRREAQIVAKLDHPNIVQIFGTGLTSLGQPYIAMQYIDGGSLRDKLKQLAERGKLLTTEQALNITRQVALALALAHEANVVHRDLKPGNVLIRPDGTPVLVDLGIAMVAGGPKLTQTGGIVGTPSYMSAEQVRGLPLDGRSDLYSLGIILYEMLSGGRPFEAEESIAVLHKQVYEEPVPLDEVRPDLSIRTCQIVERCLKKEPAQRYQNAQALVAAIDMALQAEGSHGPNPQATQVLTHLEDSDLISRRQVVQAVSAEVAAPERKVPIWAVVALLVLVAAVVLAVLSPSLGGNLPLATATVGVNLPTRIPTEAVAEIIEGTQAVTTSTVAPTATPIPAATSTPLPTNTHTPAPSDTPMPSPTSDTLPESFIGQDGMEMRLVRAGTFIMGSTSDQVDQAVAACRVNPDGDSCTHSEFTSEMPQRSVFVSAFYMDVTEVTNAQYQVCVGDGRCSLPASGSGRYSRSNYYEAPQFANYPVVWVSWFDARDYCTWAGKRLPTEAEWEKAARGEDGRVYPWGDTFSTSRANTQDNGNEVITVAGQYSSGASPYGILDMGGNIWEYVADWFDPNYYAIAPDSDPQGPSSSPTGQRVLRSGSYANYQHYARVANRGAVTPGSSTQFRGIRCVLMATAINS